MKPHEGQHSQRAQDLVEDLFDLGLLTFGIVWAVTEVHFGEETLAKVAVAGAGLRAVGRRVFRAVLGPRINQWFERQQGHISD